MLDTIVLTLPEHQFRIVHPERFNPPAHNLRQGYAGHREVLKFVYNPSKTEKRLGYKPRLTVYRRPVAYAESITLKIEFSAPKLLFGNNFEEIGGSTDLPALLGKLMATLGDMGIETKREYLEHAKVSAVHYSKNILLERTTPCFLIIQALEKLDLSQKLDLTQTDFRNAGQMVKYHASNYEVALYDKVKDLEQAAKYGEKRGAEQDYDGQLNLFSKHKEKPEVLRFEVRLTSRKLTSLLNTLRIKSGKTLVELFNLDIARSVLLHYWETITQGLFMLNISTENTEKLICAIRAQFPRMRPTKVMTLMAYITACQNMGMRPARQMLRLSDSAWAKLKKEAKALQAQKLCPRFQTLNAIKSELTEFIPLAKQDIVVEGLL
ncbi:MAG TPA: hypothetical protein DIS76_05240 [Rhodospirillaceae bacterium]|nr:hypothetical protein [Rhodospirillaceae bacterium]